MSEKVNHPDHYNISGRKECIVEMEEIFGADAVKTFCKLNAYKYKYRHELKGGQEDLDKAKWYEDYMRRLEQETCDYCSRGVRKEDE
jgi:coenzyme F420-reducing hydrogenase beta subunit